ncbi:UDP-N-acetylmuramoyl-L-alanine--D-glutamate ligase [Marinigracilibium pacificum]|uniref:UDP-N-acetylmuramoylalanine--D-glutamate ligase n=1 Tax=Marinigracilibium pacificum TaxID=2729599 RepID=A0A848J2X7_9BACT|nr:UDP-N-acetylmuramoyl-L-alanine--D-glutamate ligase [Marinigracilibium pacificum]NMM50081.1 UDP-N-acetylmuramoyl-L-alanine--D-glutamate ligase [Marinigracilibium pacificum]
MADRIIILGAGESGTGAALLAKSKGFEVFLSDKGAIADKYKQQLSDAGVFFEEGGHDYSRWVGAVLAVKSPGIPPHAEPIAWCKEQSIPVIGEIEWGARFTNKPIVAITGTNGKTTTTLLAHHLITSSGLNYALTGNVGKSFANAVISDGKYDGYVVEISSFQLDDIVEFRPHIGVLLNVTPDHLDRYQYNMDLYLASKMRLVMNMNASDYFIANTADEYTSKGVDQGSGDYKLISINKEGNTADVLISDEAIAFAVGGKEFVVGNDELPIKGPHNQVNAAAAISAALLTGIEPEVIKQHLKSFVNAPHRLQLVREINGVEYVNDSKATNLEAVFYAIKSFKKPIIWIAGGVDKGNDYELIKPLIREKVKSLVCMGVDNKKLVESFTNEIKVFDTDSIKKALAVAYTEAQQGDVVLLSPACASFDLFKNYEDRGNQFIDAVNKLGEGVSND